MVAVGDRLQVSYEGGEVNVGGGTGEESSVQGDTPGHGLVGGESQGAGGAGPGGVIVQGVGGQHRILTLWAQEAAQVRPQL